MIAFELSPEDQGSPLPTARLELGDSLTIGRAREATYRIREGGKVSRHHAHLEAQADGVIVRDLGSRNGTFVNDARVVSARLHEGDRLGIGEVVLVLTVSLDDTLPLSEEIALASTLFPPAPGEEASGPTLPELHMSHLRRRCNVCTAAVPDAVALLGTPICQSCVDRRRSLRPDQPTQIASFELIRHVADGGMGSVYEARERGSSAHAAVKLLRGQQAVPVDVCRRFLREQRASMSLVHPRIVRCIDAGQDEDSGQLFVASEFVEGGDLEAIAGPESNVRRAVELICSALDGLAYLHERHFVHRDIKPSNILMDAGGEHTAKLADFGLVKNLRESGAASLTNERDLAGSMHFVAPEQLKSFRSVGPSADIYGMMTCLFFVLTGKSALALDGDGFAASFPAVCVATLEGERRVLHEVREEVPQAIGEIVGPLIAADPSARSEADAASLAAELRAALR